MAWVHRFALVGGSFRRALRGRRECFDEQTIDIIWGITEMHITHEFTSSHMTSVKGGCWIMNLTEYEQNMSPLPLGASGGGVLDHISDWNIYQIWDT